MAEMSDCLGRPMIVTVSASPDDEKEPSPSPASLRGLDGANLFLAGLSSGFGPYVAVYLADRSWSQRDIGFVLTIGGVAALLSQVPGGELLDIVRAKRALVALGGATMAVSALIIGYRPDFLWVAGGLVLQGLTGGFLGAAIAAISLGLVGQRALADRLGRNQRFASTGGLLAAGIMGLAGYVLSYRAIFLVSAALAVPLFVSLVRIGPEDVHFARSCGAPQHPDPATPPPRAHRLSMYGNFGLFVFGICLFLFQFANASMLPLAGEALAYQGGHRSALLISALIVMPQIVVALMAPWAGRHARIWGRKRLLLIGFAALPIRAVLFGLFAHPFLLIGFQVLDGISGTMLGVLTALVVSDLTSGSGRFNLSQGLVGVASGVGASLSTAASGLLVDRCGLSVGFFSIAAVALLGTLILFLFMPETRPDGINGTQASARGPG